MINPFKLLIKYVKQLLYIDPNDKYRVVEVMRDADFNVGTYVCYEVERKVWYYNIINSWVVVVDENLGYDKTFTNVAGAKYYIADLIREETMGKVKNAVKKKTKSGRKVID